MLCEEKRALQRACTAAWESYETCAREAGIPAGGLPDLLKFHKMIAGLWRLPDAPDRLSAAFRSVFQLRSAHLTASRALSLHLARHRC